MLHLAVATVVFYALHSLFAWTGVKQWASTALGLVRWYRLAYTLQSLVLLAWVFHAYRSAASHHVLLAPSALLTIVAWTLVALGGLIASAAVLRFGGAGFIGLAEEKRTGLVRSGLHGRVRHPIYAGVILVLLGWILLDSSAATAMVVGITLCYLPVGIALEERKLIAVFGEEYVRYRKEVPALWPRW